MLPIRHCSRAGYAFSLVQALQAVYFSTVPTQFSPSSDPKEDDKGSKKDKKPKQGKERKNISKTSNEKQSGKQFRAQSPKEERMLPTSKENHEHSNLEERLRWSKANSHAMGKKARNVPKRTTIEEVNTALDEAEDLAAWSKALRVWEKKKRKGKRRKRQMNDSSERKSFRDQDKGNREKRYPKAKVKEVRHSKAFLRKRRASGKDVHKKVAQRIPITEEIFDKFRAPRPNRTREALEQRIALLDVAPPLVYPPAAYAACLLKHGEKNASPTKHIRITDIGITPLPSDLTRLVPDKQNIPNWRNEEADFKAYPARDPQTFSRLPTYHVIFPIQGPSELYFKHLRSAFRPTRLRRFLPPNPMGPNTADPTVLPQTNVPEREYGKEQQNKLDEDIEGGNSDQVPSYMWYESPSKYLNQTLPLPSYYPVAKFLPDNEKTLLNGGLFWLNYLFTTTPPTKPSHSVLLSMSSLGGSTVETGRLPRTKEILWRLLDEEYELIGSPIDFPPNQLENGRDGKGRLASTTTNYLGEGEDEDVEEKSKEVDISDVSALRQFLRMDAKSGKFPKHAIRGKRRELIALEAKLPQLKDVNVRNPFDRMSYLSLKNASEESVQPYVSENESPRQGNEEFYGITRILLPSNAVSANSPKEKKRLIKEKREIQGAEGRWLVRLNSRTEAARLVRGWNMRGFWGGEDVIIKAEIV